MLNRYEKAGKSLASRTRHAIGWLAAVWLMGFASQVMAQEPVWKTAYTKRGFVGNFDARLAGGVGTILRMRTPLCFDGTQVRVYGVGSWEKEVTLSGLWLVQGKDDKGQVTGKRYAITFKGEPGVTVPPRASSVVSDVISIPVQRGTWYEEDQFSSDFYPYAYEVDQGWWHRAPGTSKPGEPDSGKIGRLGLTRRIDVLTTDTRPLIACYGDSITHGFGSTPNAGTRYPDVLAKLADRPVINLGMNGDTIAHSINAPNEIAGLAGVEQVIFLMGINDIVSSTGPRNVDEYANIARQLISMFHQRKLKILWCTIPPCGGLAQMDKHPEREILREQINDWIRASKAPDAVIDFDKVLADPAKPTWLLEDCQSDRIHPNDKGYAKMGEAAAEVVKSLK
jgi:lysophospholipase L1-like esterase